jgi:hypothetical protein
MTYSKAKLKSNLAGDKISNEKTVFWEVKGSIYYIKYCMHKRRPVM